MSEALHVLPARLRGGTINKARRGEFHFRLSVGFVRDAAGRAVVRPTRRFHHLRSKVEAEKT